MSKIIEVLVNTVIQFERQVSIILSMKWRNVSVEHVLAIKYLGIKTKIEI